MKLKNAGKILTTGCLIAVFTGCQTGKLNMPNLAWWKKNDTLASEYIEPPSYQFTPGETSLAKSEEGLPPMPPEIDKEPEDSFEQDVSRTYEQLARQTSEASDRFAERVKQVEVDTRNVSGPPTRKPASPGFSNPLTPAGGATRTAQAPPSSSGSFVPRQPAATGTPGTSGTSGMTQYEKIARQSLEPQNTPSNPSAGNPLTPRNDNQLVSTSTPLQPAQRTDTGSTGSHIQNPYSQGLKSTESASLTASATNSPPANGSYPTTPYQAYQPRTGQMQAAADASPADTQLATRQAGPLQPAATGNSAAPASTSPSLNLAGQGSYAPGSIRKPAPLDPGKLQLPTSTASAPASESPGGGGGTFKR